MPFESLEADVNAAVIGALSNRALVHKGVTTVRGIFERAPAVEFGAVDSATPTFTIAPTLSVARGDTFSAGAESWVVVGIQPDGTGLQVLQLARS